MKASNLLSGATALAATCVLLTGPISAAETVFLSTQLRPIEEAEKVRKVILKDYPKEVAFIPEEVGPFITRVKAEAEAGKVSVGVLGAVHGQLPPLAEVGALDSLDDVVGQLADRKLVSTFVELGKLGTENHLYVPWMQATYIMAANKKALEYLPAGADVNTLTYDQLKEWAKNMHEATGERKLGFPAGPKGLMHRFFQGYLYPSYTGGVVRSFKSADAEAMWADFKDLWQHVTPRSTSYAFMQEPLLADEVWVAFDHTARLLDAFRQRPDEFIGFPGPAGAKGRGFMPVVIGLSIPKGTPDRAAAVSLIDYLTRAEVQVTTLQQVGFYPTVAVELPTSLPEGIKIAASAIDAQANASDAIVSLLPVGLGGKGGEFNKVYLDTFQRIVIRGQDVRKTLDAQAKKLAKVMTETGAPCWSPDAASDGPCPVE